MERVWKGFFFYSVVRWWWWWRCGYRTNSTINFNFPQTAINYHLCQFYAFAGTINKWGSQRFNSNVLAVDNNGRWPISKLMLEPFSARFCCWWWRHESSFLCAMLLFEIITYVQQHENERVKMNEWKLQLCWKWWRFHKRRVGGEIEIKFSKNFSHQPHSTFTRTCPSICTQFTLQPLWMREQILYHIMNVWQSSVNWRWLLNVNAHVDDELRGFQYAIWNGKCQFWLLLVAWMCTIAATVDAEILCH